ncbi:phosphatase PAP2 family protein [Streptomyces sp. NPDC101209]|uniref:phosphatase PAP2 family protein n=1 Tax=Streptomyces sp. NPDC101209 TaxID=3366129 RepID=UPI00382D4F87
MNTPRRLTWPYAVIALLAVAAAAFGLLHPAAASTPARKKPGATALIKRNPPPTLFPDARIAAIRRQAGEERKKADALFARWKAAHGRARDDAAFAAWAARQVPAPPSAERRTAELHQVQALARTRTAAGEKAASWLELYGKKDIWKLYLHDQRELLPARQGAAEKAALKSALKLAKTISDRLAAQDAQPAPFVLDPTLRPDKHVKPGAKGPYSYPSRHAARSAAAVTLLGALCPHRAADYEWMRAEVLYSRLYMAGHVTSDLLAGTLLGDLIGDYELAVGGH